MWLRFASEEIKGFSEGPFYWPNEGKPIEVDAVLGQELLWKKHFLDGEMVPVFVVSSESGESLEGQESPESLESYPEEFPSAEVLAGAGFSYEEALLLDRDQLIEIKGIGPKSADAILEWESDRHLGPEGPEEEV